MKAVAQVFSLDLVSKVILGLTGIMLIRFMPISEFADYVLALSTATVISQVLATGFNRTYIVGYRTLRLDRASSSFLSLQLLLIVCLAVLAYPLAGYVHGLFWFDLGLIGAICMAEFARTCFQQELRFFRFSMIELSRALSYAVGVLALVFIARSRLEAKAVLAMQAGTLLIIFAVASGRRVFSAELLHPGPAVRFLKTILQGKYRFLFGYSLVLALTTQADIFMLKALSGTGDVAAYGSAFRYYTLLSLALGAIHAVYLPVIQKLKSVVELRSLLHRHRRMLVVFLPVIVVGAAASRWMIPLIDGGKYPSAIPVFQILAVSSVLSFIFSPHVNLVLRFEEFRFLFIIFSGALLVDVGLNLVLIPLFGVVGAAVATSLAFAFVNIGVFLKARGCQALFPNGETERANPLPNEKLVAEKPSPVT